MAIQAFIYAVTTSFIYMLMAVGLTLIYGILHILNLAHGELYMAAATITFFLVHELGFSLLMSAVVAVVFVTILAIVLEKCLLWPLRDSFLRVVLGIVGVQMVLMGSALLAFGKYAEKYVLFPIPGNFQIFGAAISYHRLCVIGISAVLMTALYLFLKFSKHGQAMYALEQDSEGAVLQGVNVARLRLLAMAIAGALAGVAGIAAGTLTTITHTMGATPLIYGLTIVLLGGIGSVPGCVIGAFIIGFVETYLGIYANMHIASMAVFIILILILYLRPGGLLGHELS